MLFHQNQLRFPSGIFFVVLLTLTNPGWAQDQPKSEQPPPNQNVSEETPAQEDIQERGIPKFPGLQRRPVPPTPPAGTGQPSSQPGSPPTTPTNAPIPLAGHPQG